MTAWDEAWPSLRQGDVFPLPLATETLWLPDGWEVRVVMLQDVSAHGHDAVVIWAHRSPYADLERATADEARAVTRNALRLFAERLRDLLA